VVRPELHNPNPINMTLIPTFGVPVSPAFGNVSTTSTFFCAVCFSITSPYERDKQMNRQADIRTGEIRIAAYIETVAQSQQVTVVRTVYCNGGDSIGLPVVKRRW